MRRSRLPWTASARREELFAELGLHRGCVKVGRTPSAWTIRAAMGKVSRFALLDLCCLFIYGGGGLRRVPLQIPDTLRPKLLALRAKQLQHPYPDTVLVAQEVVILTLGFGPAIYLGLDGRVLIWHYMDDEPLHVTEDIAEIAAGLVIGARNNGLPELQDLLPPRPSSGVMCRACGGRRWVLLGRGAGSDEPVWLVCWECHGVGWQDAEQHYESPPTLEKTPQTKSPD